MPSSPAPSKKLATYRGKRNFRTTSEPEGGARPKARSAPEFVVQKHAASHLHYDLRLEVGGVMKSWAVPKGPSLDPSVKRLAMEVEDHPMEYNDFEGTIPKGEYGGGTVMLWDRGTYTADDAGEGEPHEKALERGYHRGKISFSFHGERLRGSYALVRTRSNDSSKPQWLLIKQEDEWADPERDLTVEVETSVGSGRTMEEIEAGKGGSRTWRSNRSRTGAQPRPGSRETPSPSPSPPDLSALQPMLAKSASAIPEDDGWTFEPKYDGIRVLAFATDRGASLVTRNGNDKARQFPDLVEALTRLAGGLGAPVVLDGEVVGVREGEIVRFESLQGRMHVKDAARVRALARDEPAALVAFDLVLVGDEVLVHDPWRDRRERLEEVLEGRTDDFVRLGETTTDRDSLVRRARRSSWEGLVAKRVDSVYRAGQRSGDWLKLKLECEQEFVVGGWTEPRKSREHLGAILLGFYDAQGELVYAGHTGTGFTRETLREMERRLRRLERKTAPFREKPTTNEPAHWTTPKVVVQVKFNEWTSKGVVRQPVFLGFRDDKDPGEVVREEPETVPSPPQEAAKKGKAAKAKAGKPAEKERAAPASARDASIDGAIVRQIRKLEKAKEDGTLTLGADRLQVTNLGKVFYPGEKVTKADLLAYYAEMSDAILPWMEDRPLVLKRYPNGIEGKAFYQQAAPDDAPAGVRVEGVALSDEKEPKPRLVGGSLATLLYTIQLGAISYDPWHSRVGDLESADYTILDLDPGAGTSFGRVVEVARWVKEEMDELGLHGALKTSGSSGIHIYLPLLPGTPLEAATLVAQIVATRVSAKHPREATVERMVKKRPRGTVYVDYLQNILGKTVAGVYAVRAKPGATVSTPLAWEELTDDLDLREFTVRTVPGRVRAVGELWRAAMRAPNSLDRLLAGS